MKKIIFSTFLLAISHFGFSQTFVPDDNFEQALIDLGLDTPPLDDFVPTANIENITNLNITGLGISDLTGIEDFTNLSTLFAASNDLTTVNLSENVELQQLALSFNNLTTIDLSNNTMLTYLVLFFNTMNRCKSCVNKQPIIFI